MIASGVKKHNMIMSYFDNSPIAIIYIQLNVFFSFQDKKPSLKSSQQNKRFNSQPISHKRKQQVLFLMIFL